MNWYFIRHGQINSNLKKVYSGHSDELLTAEGEAQVRRASRQLADIKIDAIYSSPLTRTRQTTDILVRELDWDLPIHFDDSFIELRMGPWEGMAEVDVEAQYPEEWALWNRRPAELQIDDRETLAQLQGRVLDGMCAIQRARPGRSILIVTHVAIIRVISLFADKQDLNHYKKVPVDNAKVFPFIGLKL